MANCGLQLNKSLVLVSLPGKACNKRRMKRPTAYQVARNDSAAFQNALSCVKTYYGPGDRAVQQPTMHTTKDMTDLCMNVFSCSLSCKTDLLPHTTVLFLLFPPNLFIFFGNCSWSCLRQCQWNKPCSRTFAFPLRQHPVRTGESFR